MVSWFCFFAHECLGGSFSLPGIYLWILASGLPSQREGSQATPQGQRAGGRATAQLCALGLLLSAVGCAAGTAGFIGYTATAPLALEWNGALGLWTWGSGPVRCPRLQPGHQSCRA
eukprot:SAG22_NODE_673_length_7973_cov_3.643129_7_plen_116_part_00